MAVLLYVMGIRDGNRVRTRSVGDAVVGSNASNEAVIIIFCNIMLCNVVWCEDHEADSKSSVRVRYPTDQQCRARQATSDFKRKMDRTLIMFALRSFSWSNRHVASIVCPSSDPLP